MVANPAPRAKPILVEDGWRKHAGDFYTRPLAPGVRGLLALSPNRDLPHQWRLKPYVGVIHERVNALARALVGSSGAGRYPQDTIRHRLIGLLEGPDAQERDRWLVAAEALDDNQGVFRAVAAAVRDVGLPWIEKRTSLDAVIYELEEGNAVVRRTPFLAAALWLRGDLAAAEACVARVSAKFGAPPPEIPAPLRGLRVTSFGSTSPPEGWSRPHFDAFVGRLREGMAQYPEGPPEDWRPSAGA